jgi:hypothetical protein
MRAVELRWNPLPEIAVPRITATLSKESANNSVFFGKNLHSTVPKEINNPSSNEYHYSQNTISALPKSYLAGPLGPTSECGIRDGARAAEGTWWYNATLGNVTI